MDALVGIPEGYGQRAPRPGSELQPRMAIIDEALKSPDPPPGLADLHATLSRSTVHVRERRIRHEHFFQMLTLSESEWQQRWSDLTLR